jgi:hypothetical protein
MIATRPATFSTSWHMRAEENAAPERWPHAVSTRCCIMIRSLVVRPAAATRGDHGLDDGYFLFVALDGFLICCYVQIGILPASQ